MASRAVTSQYASGDISVISAGADGSLSIKGRPASGDDIRLFLDQLRNRNDTVVIQADRRAGVDVVMRLLDDCRAAGVRRILLSSEK
jgi:biopolymer transport protein ExbD